MLLNCLLGSPVTSVWPHLPQHISGEDWSSPTNAGLEVIGFMIDAPAGSSTVKRKRIGIFACFFASVLRLLALPISTARFRLLPPGFRCLRRDLGALFGAELRSPGRAANESTQTA
jgi:hypothetical protein